MTKTEKHARVRAAALRRLAALPTVEHDPAVDDSYSRSSFGHSWSDNDGDGQDERQETLIRYHRQPRRTSRGAEALPEIGNPLVLSVAGDRVLRGHWFCRFTGFMFTDPLHLDIDHFVPLKAAWLAGAHAWTKEQRSQYSNGYGIRSTKRRSWLIPVSKGANRSKGANGPDEWLPPRTKYHVNYAATWIRTKHYWKLSVTAAERAALERILTTEGGTP